MEQITVKGTKILTETEKFELNKLLQHYVDEIGRTIKNDFFLKLVLKKHSKKKEDLGDKRALFSINAELSGAFKVIAASAGDWDFNRAIHKLMHKIEEEIEHRFHSSEQRS